METMKVGVVGLGNISDIYLKNIALFDNIESYACADLMPERAEEKAALYGCRAITTDELMADPAVDIVLNLTLPAAHCEVSLKALNAGKHVYSEKPVAASLEEGQKILAAAKEKGLKVGCAPDTFLGARPQTMRKIIAGGDIGVPVAATCFMVCHGHEHWHPSPEFYYKKGAGPLFDMGPYYVTLLVALLGPAKRVCGIAGAALKQRLIMSEPLAGTLVDVEVPTHVSGTIEFESGVIATLITSFDVWDSLLPRVEIFGSEGTIAMADPDPLGGPNSYGGDLKYRHKDESDWNAFPVTMPRKEAATPWENSPILFDYAQNSRGLGLADMARGIQTGTKFRATGEMAYHVLEIMMGLIDSSETGSYYELKSTCEIPELLPEGLPEYSLGAL